MMEITSQNNTATSDATVMINSIAWLNAILHMVMLDASATHIMRYPISRRLETRPLNSETKMTAISGTTTVTMREAHVHNVQTAIELAQDSVIAMSLDPAALENHFGNMQIYGITVSPEMSEEKKEKKM